MRRILTLLLALAVPISVAHADGIVNGDFDGIASLPPAIPWVNSGDVQIWPDGTDPGGNSLVVRIGPSAGNTVSLSQSFDCGDLTQDGVCNVTFWLLWFPSASDPGQDEVFEVTDGGTVVFSRTSAQAEPVWAAHTVSFGDCGPQTITFQVTDPNGNNSIESTARVDLVTCYCEEPIPSQESTWGAIKSLFFE